ncbi:hypothetical protein [Streptomyces tanashiensis]|uniref:hypothetical protein n=1 Tax=Streptomyces tanashiensis TaxID=67367 RepID=UPI0033D1B696
MLTAPTETATITDTQGRSHTLTRVDILAAAHGEPPSTATGALWYSHFVAIAGLLWPCTYLLQRATGADIRDTDGMLEALHALGLQVVTATPVEFTRDGRRVKGAAS